MKLRNCMEIKEKVIIDNLAGLIVEYLQDSKEYITLEEALKTTGLSEKTLRDHLRGTVPSIGRNAWFRKDFFDYWKRQFENRTNKNAFRSKKIQELLGNAI